MNDKQFTDELFRRMYVLGYRKAEIENGTVFFYKDRECISQWSDRVDVRSTYFTEKDQLIDIAEYLGIVDWSKVKVDTPILVKDYSDKTWKKRHFACFKNGCVYAWQGGETSWSVTNEQCITNWYFAKLAEV